MDIIYEYKLFSDGTVYLNCEYDILEHDKDAIVRIKHGNSDFYSKIPEDKIINNQSDLIRRMRELMEVNRDFYSATYYTSKEMFYDRTINLIELGVISEEIETYSK